MTGPQPALSTVPPVRICDWCDAPIPAKARRDAQCCSKRCRQARHRFNRAAGRAAAAAGPPVRLAYADPPYPGNAYLYRAHPDYGGEVDHGELLARLAGYDGWALSTSAAALPAVLALCPPGVRVAAWHRGERAAAGWEPLSAWEPVIYRPGRPVDPAALAERRTDSLVCGVTAMTTRPGRVTGAKPAVFCRWLFGLLGAAPGDQLDDLFPGSGAVSRAWAAFTAAEPSLGDDPSSFTGADASRPTQADASCSTAVDASNRARADAFPAARARRVACRGRRRVVIGRTYRERGRLVVVLVRWGPGGGPRNVLVRRDDGTLAVRPFRGLRRVIPPTVTAPGPPRIPWVMNILLRCLRRP